MIYIISRTDNIGDVILTLPMAGILKQKYPDCYIYFLGQKYTQTVVACSKYVDAFLDWTEIKKLPFKEQLQFFKRLSADEIIHVYPVKEIAKLSKAAKIPIRTATQNRLYHWLYCNKLIKLSRRNSILHEAQLNVKLLSDIQPTDINLDSISSFYGLQVAQPLGKDLQKYIIPHKVNLILHPKSKGSAREWGLENYANLIASLPKEKYNILLTGTEEEGLLYREILVFPYPYVHDLSGKLSLQELICLINAVDALVACSTGPLHISAALNKLTIGIYPPIRPMHPGRWAPLGKNTHVLALDKKCNICRKTLDCQCIRSITPQQVINILSHS
ncbi:MAG: glycosyltransferase family 9 protein [Bacteroidales bacterium]|jgi:ADP-heptose:LPS heptosyltransferase|nr:glycosyltransferase family 9 protein [Bacteroidales bacterium]